MAAQNSVYNRSRHAEINLDSLTIESLQEHLAVRAPRRLLAERIHLLHEVAQSVLARQDVVHEQSVEVGLKA